MAKPLTRRKERTWNKRRHIGFSIGWYEVDFTKSEIEDN